MNKYFIKIVAGTGMAIALFLNSMSVQAHCQIPCGIYDDAARVVEMLESAATVEKLYT